MGRFRNSLKRVCLKPNNLDDSDYRVDDRPIQTEVQATYLGVEPPTAPDVLLTRIKEHAKQLPQLPPGKGDGSDGAFSHPYRPPAFQRLILLYIGWIYAVLVPPGEYLSQQCEHLLWEQSGQYVDLSFNHMKMSIGVAPI